MVALTQRQRPRVRSHLPSKKPVDMKRSLAQRSFQQAQLPENEPSPRSEFVQAIRNNPKALRSAHFFRNLPGRIRRLKWIETVTEITALLDCGHLQHCEVMEAGKTSPLPMITSN